MYDLSKLAKMPKGMAGEIGWHLEMQGDGFGLDDFIHDIEGQDDDGQWTASEEGYQALAARIVELAQLYPKQTAKALPDIIRAIECAGLARQEIGPTDFKAKERAAVARKRRLQRQRQAA